MKKTLAIIVVTALTVLTGGCNHLPRGTAPSQKLVFDRFDNMQVSFDTSTDIIPEIQNKELGEYISRNENSVASWGENGGAGIWMNAAVFGEDSNRLARKYAFMVDEDSPGYNLIDTSKCMRIELEYALPGDFDDITYASEAERKKEIIFTGINMFITDIDEIRLDSDYVYSGAMMVKQAFTLLMYEIEKNPSKMYLLEERQGFDFDYPTLGPAKARVLVNQENKVRIKVKVGTYIRNFEHQRDVIDMDAFLGGPVGYGQYSEEGGSAEPQSKNHGFFSNLMNFRFKLPGFGGATTAEPQQ
ncbi:MAG: hypothetical protein AB7F23_00350 [Phycisphaerae bacterium]